MDILYDIHFTAYDRRYSVSEEGTVVVRVHSKSGEDNRAARVKAQQAAHEHLLGESAAYRTSAAQALRISLHQTPPIKVENLAER